MKVSSRVDNSKGIHKITLSTGDLSHSLSISPKPSGFGSSASGGELLFLALATCYCNDIYREAGKRGIQVERVEVEVEGSFGGEGDPAQSISYNARVTARATEREIQELLRHTDTVAEIQNTLRVPTQVALSGVEAVSV